MAENPLRRLARRFEQRCLRPVLRKWRPRQRNPAAAAFARIESRLDLLEHLLRESVGLQHMAMEEAGVAACQSTACMTADRRVASQPLTT